MSLCGAAGVGPRVMSRVLAWVAGGLLLFFFALARSVLAGYVNADEAWFLQVVVRFNSGEALYRDVFLGVTPLSVYAAAPLTLLFGAEVLVIKALVALCFACTILLACRITRQMGLSRPSDRLVVAAALCAYAAPGAAVGAVPYTYMAGLFLLACFGATLSWAEAQRGGDDKANPPRAATRALVFAGVFAGLCFASKQNVGLYTLAALFACVLAVARGTRRATLGPLGVAAGAFALTASLALLPVLFDGGAEKLLDYGFTGKGNYIRYGQMSYVAHLRKLLPSFSALTDNPFIAAVEVYRATAFLLPPAALALMLLARLRSEGRARVRLTTALLFGGAAFVGVFPRVSFYHLSFALATLLPGLAYACCELARAFVPMRAARVARVALLAWLGAGVAALTWGPIGRARSPGFVFSSIPHLRGVLAEPERLDEIETSARTLLETARSNRRVFLLTPRAGLFYLVTGLRNPTPFDYPLVTAFGREGEATTVARIERGEIEYVCMELQGETPMAPRLLEDYVTRRMQHERSLGFCELYRAH